MFAILYHLGEDTSKQIPPHYFFHIRLNGPDQVKLRVQSGTEPVDGAYSFSQKCGIGR